MGEHLDSRTCWGRIGRWGTWHSVLHLTHLLLPKRIHSISIWMLLYEAQPLRIWDSADTADTSVWPLNMWVQLTKELCIDVLSVDRQPVDGKTASRKVIDTHQILETTLG